ncbi:response regulator [Rhizobium sp. FKL33]|uniref:response regulator n=1 Tax=Rhizobium sp. FKL33 TaxID=2562307 RepID=UPI0010C008CA|nr:response regulator [Rhizobium sp. FKL33]
MRHSEDPLLRTVCDRVLQLDAPAFVKDSELRYVVVNEAFGRLFDVKTEELIGRTGRDVGLDAGLDLHDKERSCVVFGDEQTSHYLDPAGKGFFNVELERFELNDGRFFLYCRFAPKALAPQIDKKVEFQARAAALSLGMDMGQIDSILDILDVGVVLWSPDGRLAYANERLWAFYAGIEGLKTGISFREFSGRMYDYFACIWPDAYPPDNKAKQAWIETRVEWHSRDVAADQVLLPNGRHIQFMNRRLADGSVLGMRIDVTDMKRREELLDKHVQEISLYRELLDRLPVATFARDIEHKLVYANRRFSELWGSEPGDLIGLTEHEMFPPDRADYLAACNERTLVECETIQHEIDIPAPDGTIRGMARTDRIRTERGLTYLVGAITDITGVRQRELMLEEASRKTADLLKDIEDIISNVDVGILVLDSSLNIQMMNDAYHRHLWKDMPAEWLEDMVGLPFTVLLEESHRRLGMETSWADYRRQRMEEIQASPITPREIVLHDGMRYLYSSINLSRGRIMLCYFDVTDLRRRDREVTEARAEVDNAYRLIKNATDTMPQGVCVIENGKIVFANSALAQIFGVPPEVAAVGNDWRVSYDAIPFRSSGENLDLLRAEAEDAVANHRDLTRRYQLENGRWFKTELRWSGDGQGVVLVSDQTGTVERENELQRLVAKAETADKVKSEFLANIGVEFRTPLNGILGMAELLGKSPLDTRQRAFIEIIQKSGKALMAIINDIIEFSKLDSGHIQLKYAAFNPAEALDDVATLFASRAAEKDLELIVERKGELPAKVMGDAGRFRQVLTNLISNAIQFTERGYVLASVQATPDTAGNVILQVRVEDTGVGIPADKLDTIFDKFSQIDLSISRSAGSGLGLAIAQRLAQIQGGVITVHSVEGMGTEFSFALPAQVAAESRRPEPLSADLAQARIVVIDDHEQTRTILCDNIANWGFECVGAADALTGYSIIRAASESSLPVDAIVVDETMPGESGCDLVERLRAEPAYAGLPVIMLASGELASDAPAASIPVDAYLTKPVRMPILRATLIDVIRARRSDAGSPSFAVEADEPGDDGDCGPDVLVIEDNDINQIFFDQILSEAGLKRRIVGDAASAEAAWREKRPALVLMDLTLPDASGQTLLLLLRALDAALYGGDVPPIIGVVSRGDDACLSACMADGMVDSIAKPMTPDRVIEKIRQYSPDLLAPIEKDAATG